MSKQYVIKSKDRVFEEYAVFVAEKVEVIQGVDGFFVDWEFSSTDNQSDATKFKWVDDAFVMMEIMKLHEDDWEVQVVVDEEY